MLEKSVVRFIVVVAAAAPVVVFAVVDWPDTPAVPVALVPLVFVDAAPVP